MAIDKKNSACGRTQDGKKEGAPHSSVRAIIFDIDGVLADSREAVMRNTLLVLSEFGFQVKREEIEKLSSAYSADSVFIALAPNLVDDPALLKRMLLRLSVATAENMGLVKPTLLAARIPAFAKKYRLAIATNRKASADIVLEKMGVQGYFEAVVTSADAPAKPAPDMLLIAIERLGVEKREVLFVGDNVEDAAAANAAGIAFLLLDGLRSSECEKFVRRFLD